jgi:hypothetical protein
MLFKNSVRTSKRTPHFTITTINWLTLFKEIITIYKPHRLHKNAEVKKLQAIFLPLHRRSNGFENTIMHMTEFHDELNNFKL